MWTAINIKTAGGCDTATGRCQDESNHICISSNLLWHCFCEDGFSMQHLPFAPMIRYGLISPDVCTCTWTLRRIFVPYYHYPHWSEVPAHKVSGCSGTNLSPASLAAPYADSSQQIGSLMQGVFTSATASSFWKKGSRLWALVLLFNISPCLFRSIAHSISQHGATL